MEGIDSLADEVGVLGGEFSGIEAGNDADERRVTLNVVAPMIFAQAEAEDIVKLCFGAGQLDVSHHMGLRLLVQEPVVAMTSTCFNSALKASRSTCFGFSPGLCRRGNIT